MQGKTVHAGQLCYWLLTTITMYRILLQIYVCIQIHIIPLLLLLPLLTATCRRGALLPEVRQRLRHPGIIIIIINIIIIIIVIV